MLATARTRLSLLTAAAITAGIAAAVVGSPASATTTSLVSGSAFGDSNRNAVRDAGESGWSGLYVYLEDGTTGRVLQTATTASDGSYSFAGVADGSYRLEISGTSWSNYQQDWVPTTTTGLYPRTTFTVSGANVSVGFGLRQIVRSTTLGQPISTFTAANGTRFDSYDDVVSAQQLASDLASGAGLLGDEAPHVSVRFDYDSVSATSTSVGQDSSGRYTTFSATSSITYSSWVSSGDATLFHEYGHAWSLYNAYIVHQDPNLTGYLQARGLANDSRVGSSYEWSPREMIAEDYRELFGTANAASSQQMNTAIPNASAVAGLQAFLRSYGASPAPDAPTSLTATAKDGSVSLTWSRATSGAVPAGYRIYRNGTPVASTTSTSFNDSNLINGTTYSYSVTAYNSTGESAQSAAVAATPAPAPAVTGVAMNPAPVKASGTASFTLDRPAAVTVRVLSSSGAVVRTLLSSANEGAGTVSVSWGRTNDAGKRVGSGSYQLSVSASNASGTTSASTGFSVS